MIVVNAPTKQRDPVVGQHWRNLDTEHLVALYMYQLSCELREAGSQIPVAKLFVLEAVGYIVNLETGIVGRADG